MEHQPSEETKPEKRGLKVHNMVTQPLVTVAYVALLSSRTLALQTPKTATNTDDFQVGASFRLMEWTLIAIPERRRAPGSR